MTLVRWYPWIKALHVTTVALSYSLFATRGVWMLRGSPLLRRRWVRVVPHVNDTVLLASGITLAVIIRQYPGVSPWLTAKLIGLVVYILMGMAAFRFARRRWVRTTFWIGAQAVFFYIVAVALTRQPLPF
ncbi:MAG: SirB2 family protein [Gammaproteobacteria bacterium]